MRKQFLLVLLMTGCGDVDMASDSSFSGEPRKSEIFNWREHIKFTQVPDSGFSGNTYGSEYYRDIMAHSKRKITQYSPTTNAHETNHMLNNETRNSTSARDNTMYFERGQAAMVNEPTTSSSTIRNYVPQFVKDKSSKYRLYVVEQTSSWTNILYQFDEWSGYRTDARVAMEMMEAGTFKSAEPSSICINDGAIEFLYFASAAIRSLAINEPNYLMDLQFKSGFAMLAEQSIQYYNYGKGKRELDCDGTAYLEHFRTSTDNAGVRSTLKTWMGEEWTTQVLGF